MFRRFLVSFSRFMYGRYGFDRMFRGLTVAYLVLWAAEMIIGIFTDWYTVYSLIRILMFALFVWMFFRVLSRNVDARRRENERYCAIVDRIKGRSGNYGGRSSGGYGGSRQNRYGGNRYGNNPYNNPYGGQSNPYGGNHYGGQYAQNGNPYTNGDSRVEYRRPKPKTDRKTHKYVKCKNCGATLRLKRRKGTHTATCPKCKGIVKVRSLW